eukprot:15460699-Alexandrium_andersonii.AAC.1
MGGLWKENNDVSLHRGPFYSSCGIPVSLLKGRKVHARTHPRTHARTHARTICSTCNIACAWRAPRATDAGIAWCAACLPPVQVAESGAEQVLHAVGLGGTPGPENWTAAVSLHAGGRHSCPLCGLGNVFSEHVCLWCPAEALAASSRGAG